MLSITLGIVAALAMFTLVAAGALGYHAIRQRKVRTALAMLTPSGIAEGRFVTIGGIEQWIQIRGEDRANPILLFLNGHGLSMPPLTPILRSWERHFTVVLWDQRSVGKTLVRNGKADSHSWSFERLAEDGVAVTEFVCRHLGQAQIILLGHSQGSIVGVLMAKRRPDLFHAYVGTGQVIDLARNEPISYEMAVERARAAGNKKAIKALARVGPPPYQEARSWVVKQRWSFVTDPEFRAWSKLALRMVLSAHILSLKEVYLSYAAISYLPERLFAEIMAFDARRLGAAFAMPFFVFQGGRDCSTLPALAEEYVATVEAPRKAMVLLKDGGHMAVLMQPEQFLTELRERVLPLVSAPLAMSPKM
jgi:pimeloyl-ACP methyl ester carboxylesterase